MRVFISLSRILTICLLASWSGSVYTAVSTEPLSENIIDSFWAALPGNWDGQAVETPVGPVDYPINFHQCDKHVIAGVAELRVSDHHWRFWQSDGELHLTFLSTFRGNQQPTQLVVSRTENNTIWFHAPELALLTLSLTLLSEVDVAIRVFHHQKPHVHIRLTRSDKKLTASEHVMSAAQSCKRL